MPPRTSSEVVLKIEMNLSAFGVESDNFPSIDAKIDFLKDTSLCVKSYYNPAYKDSLYQLSKAKMATLLKLVQTSDLNKLKSHYKVEHVDQPSSKTVIYTTKRTYVISDYGLKGDAPLPDMYKIVYQID
ncbi:MAG: hypothetical protein EAZ57_10315 [Cytophagales bacterium]|nr:MAG: hypothetical protein EAZ57_10315 [Cytophagales bacterium]